LAPLYRLAKATGCAVVAVLHLNKGQGLSPLQRLGGSVAFGNAARSVLLLDRDPDDGDQGARRVLAHIKCNVGPEMPSLLYEVAPIVLPAKGTAPMMETSERGINERMLQRARSKVGAQKEKAGFTRGWEWWIPVDADKDIPFE
jgi:hypothetical protein